VLVEGLALLGADVAEEVEQDHDAATYAPKVNREVGRLDWSRTAQELADHVRGMDPVPGAWSSLNGTPVKLSRPVVWTSDDVAALDADGAHANGGPRVAGVEGEPGLVLRVNPGDGVLVAAGEGGVSFLEAQPPGKRRMSVVDWINGRGVESGQRFE
jgi:methionyl-tRNA formyltransferase